MVSQLKLFKLKLLSNSHFSSLSYKYLLPNVITPEPIPLIIAVKETSVVGISSNQPTTQIVTQESLLASYQLHLILKCELEEKEFPVTSCHTGAGASYWKIDSSSRKPEQLQWFVYPKLLNHVCRRVLVASILLRTRDRSNYTIGLLCDEL
jgi:hypothetical protein